MNCVSETTTNKMGITGQSSHLMYTATAVTVNSGIGLRRPIQNGGYS